MRNGSFKEVPLLKKREKRQSAQHFTKKMQSAKLVRPENVGKPSLQSFLSSLTPETPFVNV